jgi:hypothetical protein
MLHQCLFRGGSVVELDLYRHPPRETGVTNTEHLGFSQVMWASLHHYAVLVGLTGR